MSETTIAPERVEVEAPAEPQRWAGQSLPRKEDGRLLQGQGVFVDDIKRHNMGYAHYVRSPYAHAVIKSVDVSAALALPGVYGTLTGDEVATLTDPFFQLSTPPGKRDQGLRAGRRPGALRRRPGGDRRRGDPRARARRVRARRGRVRPAAGDHRRAPLTRRGLPGPPPGRRLEPRLGGRLRVGQLGRRGRGGRPDREDPRAPLRPVQQYAARVRRRPRRVQPRHRPVDDLLQQPVPGLRGDHDGPSAAHGPRQDALCHAGHRRRLRQQDHVAPAAARHVPARAQAEPRDPVDGVAHRVPSDDVPRERALVPGDRDRGQERRHHARLPDEGARRRGRVHALRAARRRHLGAGHARRLPLEERPPRLHAGRDEQGAVQPEPRLLAHAAPLVHRAHDGHRRARARPRPDRGAQAQLHPRRRDAVHDAERLRLRLRRLRRDARHGARAARAARPAPRRRPSARASCSASGSERHSTAARTTSPSRV